jgi:hypothetical protein
VLFDKGEGMPICRSGPRPIGREEREPNGQVTATSRCRKSNHVSLFTICSFMDRQKDRVNSMIMRRHGGRLFQPADADRNSLRFINLLPVPLPGALLQQPLPCLGPLTATSVVPRR